MTKGIIIFFVVSILALVITLVINGTANWIESRPSPPEQRFEVVDNYKGCDVVRYSTEYDARYHYFLDCRK